MIHTRRFEFCICNPNSHTQIHISHLMLQMHMFRFNLRFEAPCWTPNANCFTVSGFYVPCAESFLQIFLRLSWRLKKIIGWGICQSFWLTDSSANDDGLPSANPKGNSLFCRCLGQVGGVLRSPNQTEEPPLNFPSHKTFSPKRALQLVCYGTEFTCKLF